MSSEKDTKQDTEVVIPFGEKKVRKHGDYTRVIALDKKALQACGCSTEGEIMARIELVKKPDQDFLKVTPFCKSPQNEADSPQDESATGEDKVE